MDDRLSWNLEQRNRLSKAGAHNMFCVHIITLEAHTRMPLAHGNHERATPHKGVNLAYGVANDWLTKAVDAT